MEKEVIIENTKKIAEYFNKKSPLNSEENKELSQWIIALSFLNNKINDIETIKSEINKIISPIDDFKFSQKILRNEPTPGAFRSLVLNFQEIENKIVNSGIGNREVVLALCPTPTKNNVNLMSYFINIAQTDIDSLSDYSIAITFLLNCTEEAWKKIEQINPTAFDKIESAMELRPNNLMQEVAKFNPSIYQLAKTKYPHIKLFQHPYDPMFIAALQNKFNIGIFVEETKDIWHQKGQSDIIQYSSLLQKRMILSHSIKDKKISDMNLAEITLGESFFVGANFLTDIFKKDSAYKEFSDVFLHVIENTKSSHFIAEIIYSLSREKPENHNLELKVFNSIKKNSNNIKVPFTDIIENKTLSRIYSDIDFLNKIIDIPQIKLIRETEDFKTLCVNLSCQIYDIVFSGKKDIDLIVTSKNITHLLDNSKKEFIISYVFEKDYDDKNDIGNFKIVGNIKVPESHGLHQKPLGIIKSKDPLDLILFIDSMNGIQFNQVFSHKMPSMLSSNINENERKFLRETILEKNKDSQILSENDISVVTHNFIQITQLYSPQELRDGAFNQLMDAFKINMNSLVDDCKFYSFLYEHRDTDLSIYGLDYNNPNILKTMVNNHALDLLEETHHLLPNPTYKDEKGNNLLMMAVKNLDHFGVLEIAKYYPELSSEINKSKKMPIQQVLSKIKIMKEDNKDYYKYSLMFKSLINLELNKTPQIITGFLNDCSNSELKLDKILTGWRELILKSILHNAMKENNKNNNSEELDLNNEWKI